MPGPGRRALRAAIVAALLAVVALPAAAHADDASGPWLAMERSFAAPWPALQRSDGSFPDYVVANAASTGQRDEYGPAFLGLALLQDGVRDGDDAAIGAGLRALANAARHPIADRRVVFQNLALATAYDLARGALGADPRFAAVRPALEARLRAMRLVIFGSGREYYNYYLVESIVVLELERSGLSGGADGSILAGLPAAVAGVVHLLAHELPSSAARYTRGDATAIVSDAPWNPLAYHAFSLGLLARATDLLGARTPAAARGVLVRGVQATSALIAPDGDVTYFGRSQEQAWALGMTAYASEVAAAQPGVSAAQAGADRTITLRVLARLRDLHGGGAYGFTITPALRQDLRAGVEGLDLYAAAVSYTGLTLTALNWTLERMAAQDIPPAPTASDAPGAAVLSRDDSTLAVVRTEGTWFAVKQAPAVHVPGRVDYSRDLRYDFGLSALKARAADGSWHDVLRLRPHSDVPDSAGPVLLAGGERYLPRGDRLRVGTDGTVGARVGFATAAGATLARTEVVSYAPVACGVQVTIPTHRGDDLEYSVFLIAGSAAARGDGTGVDDAAQHVALSRPARVELERGYHSGSDASLTRARLRFADADGTPLTITVTDAGC